MASTEENPASEPGSTSFRIRIVLFCFLLSGGAALIYEVTWTRALSVVLGSTVYAMSTMLSTFMAGLAIGSYLGGKLADRSAYRIHHFALCELGIALTGLLSIPLIYSLPSVYLLVYRALHLYPIAFFAVQIGLCACVMLIPTTLMGATFPLVSRELTLDLREMGRKVGDAYSFNTVGAVLGSLSVGFLLLPRLGIKGATAVAAALNGTIGITMLVLSGKRPGRMAMLLLPGFIIAVTVLAWSRPETTMLNFYHNYRHLRGASYESILHEERTAMREVFYEEHAEGAVRAYRTREGLLVLQVAGKLEGTGASDVPNTLLLAYLPIAFHPEARNFLNIGLGAGVTLAAAKQHVAEVDMVEINPGVINAVSLYGAPGVLDGVNVYINDARNHLLTTSKRYDVISAEPSYPTEAGVANLFSREFFQIVVSKLTDEGKFCQWLPYYLLSNDDVTMMIKTFRSVFPYTYLWKVANEDLLLIGSLKSVNVTADEIRSRVDALNQSGIPLVFNLSRTPEQIDEIMKSSSLPINTDDRPRIEFRVANNILLGDLSLLDKRERN